MTNEQEFQGGHTPVTPPPAPSAPRIEQPAPTAGDPEPTGSGRSSGATAITVLTAIVGGVALLSAGGTAAVAATGDLANASGSDASYTVGVDGIDRLDLDVDARGIRIEFGDVDEAQLEVRNNPGRAWTFERDGDDLVVRSPESRWGWWFGSWFGNEGTAVLTLPESLNDGSLDADLTLDAGSLDMVGDFAALGVDVGAGSVDIEGSATSLDADMSAGRADILLDGVDDVTLGVSAGDFTVELTGTPPTSTVIDVSAGSVDLTVPDVGYAITQDVSAGSLDAKVDQSDPGDRTIDVTVAAGSVTVRPGR